MRTKRTTSIAFDITSTICYQYADDVLSGKITACKRVKQACKRFISDLEQMNNAKYRWTFDVERAYRPIRFIEKYLRPTKGAYESMELLPWQHFIEANLYGWVDKKTGLRRYRNGLIVVGSGNGKSTLVAGNAAYAASKDFERGAEVYTLANSKDQAKLVFGECKAQIKNSPVLAKRFRSTRDGVYYDATNSKIQPLCSDSIALDGSNPHLAIFDEIHEYRTHTLINVINKKKIKRRQPLSLYITTMGNVIDGPLMDFYVMGGNILDGLDAVAERVADRWFVYIAEIDEEDEPDDVQCWIKANPSLGVLLSLEDLRDDWEACKLVPENRANFINKQLNVFTSVSELSYLDAETILRNNARIDPSILIGRRGYGGFDLSETEDFTSAGIEFPMDDKHSFFLSHTWVPERKVRMDSERIDYKGMQQEGVLTICKGAYVDYKLVLQWYLDMAKLYKIVSIGYDPANAHFLVQELEKKGFTLSPVRQGALTLNAPIKGLKEIFLDGRVITNGNRMYRWSLSNVKLARDRNGNWLPTKQSKYRKIDPFMAHLIAHAEYMRLDGKQADPKAPIVTVINV